MVELPSHLRAKRMIHHPSEITYEKLASLHEHSRRAVVAQTEEAYSEEYFSLFNTDTIAWGLIWHPSKSVSYDWDKVSGSMAVTVIRSVPARADLFNWNNRKQTIAILKELPQYAVRVDFSKYTGSQMVSLLSARPKFANRCDMSKLTEKQWMTLIQKQPILADYIKHEPSKELASLIAVNKCGDDHESINAVDTSVLNSKQLLKVLLNNPALFDPKHVDQLEVNQWYRLLKRHPQLSKSFDLDDLESDQVWDLVKDNPMILTTNKVSSLRGWQWRKLLQVYPYDCVINQVEWEAMNGMDIVIVITRLPHLAMYCDWNKLNELQWELLLKKQPQFLSISDRYLTMLNLRK